jgi:gamma-glutamyl hercynylcysteine S-oxide synthase
LFSQLSEEQLAVAYDPLLNLPLWELGHIGWFQEFWCLRVRLGREPRGSLMTNADAFYDSTKVEHTKRWELNLPNLVDTLDYLSETLDATLARLAQAQDNDDGLYFFRLALFHEKMHVEAFRSTWQTLGYPLVQPKTPEPVSLTADLKVPAGELILGSEPGQGFVFDNEKWAHRVSVDAFEISSSPVLNSEYFSFVQDDGYLRSEWWDPEYFASLQASGRVAPRFWNLKRGRLQENWFGQLESFEPQRPVAMLSAYEAEAYCRWARRRLPTEIEWEMAAVAAPTFEWGSSVWEWTSTPFNAFPGFSPDPYKEYSEPWFGTHRVVKGGSFLTPPGMAHVKFRNFYTPNRNDIFVGFRTCALIE